MPRGGHNAKSTEQHKQNGTYQKVRHANRMEAEAVISIPDAPADFNEEHKRKRFGPTRNTKIYYL